MATRFRINDRGLKKLQAPGADVDRAVRRAAEIAVDRAKGRLQDHQYRTGNPTRFTFNVRRVTNSPTGRVRYSISARAVGRDGADLALIYEKGSKPHIIVAHSSRKPLVFTLTGRGGGKKVIVPRGGSSQSYARTIRGQNTIVSSKGYVDHPGTKAVGYMRSALRQVNRRDFRR